MIDPRRPDFGDTPVSPARTRFGYAPADPSKPAAVTIVTPFYNPGSVFHETASSVLQQSLQQWEWVIVNDGSTDPESLDMLDDYRASDPRIRVIDHDENRGPSAARNTGFRAARSSYVVQFDTDDLLEPTAVEKWVWFLESHPECDFVKGFSVGFGAEEYLWQKGFHDGVAFLDENLAALPSAVRNALHETVGGYDETIRDGLEDWDFWLRCASVGRWGDTVPEYLAWYRRRARHGDRWANWDNASRQRAFRTELRRRYPRLWSGHFPRLETRPHLPDEPLPEALPWENRLRKDKRRLLLVAPWMTVGGADKFNVDLLEQLGARSWEITVATTLKGDHSWLPRFTRHTPDIFVLDHFLRRIDYPRFLWYLIRSRQIDVVLISNSELAYRLLPYLKSRCPGVAFVDLCHMEEEHWQYGGYPRMAVEHQELLDLNVVVSEHLKAWMVARGADGERVRVCYTNVDAERWRPDPERRQAVRNELGLDGNAAVILYAGRLVAQKQPRIFARTMLELHRRGGRWVGLAAGDGEELPWLRAFVRRHALGDRVRLLGAVPTERVRDLMAAADIFFLPSQWEGIALTLYEAMASRLAVVATDVGGQRELVTPDCGVLVPRGDEDEEPQRYAEVLASLLARPERRHEMGEAARKRVSLHFRLEEMGEKMEALLREAMALHGAEPRPVPTPGLARICAARAIEHLRLVDISHPLAVEAHVTGWRSGAYFGLRRILLPVGRAALARDVRWLLRLKDGVKRILLGGDQL